MSLFNYFAAIGDKCTNNASFLGIKPWYRYLPQSQDALGNCSVIKINGVSNAYLLILLGIMDILLRVAAIVSVVFIIVGGVQFIAAQGEPDRAASARSTVINALIGLVISVVSASIVTYIAGQFK